MIEEKISQAPRNAFSGVSCQTSRKKRSSTFDERQPDKAKRDPNESSRQAVSDIFTLCQNIISKVTQQHVGECLRQRRDGQRSSSADIWQTIIDHHLPKPFEAILFDGFAEVKCQGGFVSRLCCGHFY